jgi:hypothetical protein
MAHSGIAFHTTPSFVSHPSCCDARAPIYTQKVQFPMFEADYQIMLGPDVTDDDRQAAISVYCAIVKSAGSAAARYKERFRGPFLKGLTSKDPSMLQVFSRTLFLFLPSDLLLCCSLADDTLSQCDCT